MFVGTTSLRVLERSKVWMCRNVLCSFMHLSLFSTVSIRIWHLNGLDGGRSYGRTDYVSTSGKLYDIQRRFLDIMFLEGLIFI